MPQSSHSKNTMMRTAPRKFSAPASGRVQQEDNCLMNLPAIPLALSCLAAASAFAQSYTINTMAGGAPRDGTPATNLALVFFGAGNTVATDPAGNLYFASLNLARIYRVNGDGTVTQSWGMGPRDFRATAVRRRPLRLLVP